MVTVSAGRFAAADILGNGAGEELLGGEIQLAEYLAGRFSGGAAFLSGDTVIISRNKQGYGTGQLYHGEQPQCNIDTPYMNWIAVAGGLDFLAVDLGFQSNGSYHVYGNLGLVDNTAAAGIGFFLGNGIVAAECFDIPVCTVEDNSLVPYGGTRKRTAFVGAGVFVSVHGEAESIGDVNGEITVLKGYRINGYAYAAYICTSCFNDVHAFGKTAPLVKTHGQLADTVSFGAGIEYPLGFNAYSFLENIGMFLVLAHNISLLPLLLRIL